jgi:hypothetical protein
MIEIQSTEGNSVQIPQKTAELSGLFRNMLEEEEEDVIIPMPWSFEDVKQVTHIMTKLADELGNESWDSYLHEAHLSLLATKFIIPQPDVLELTSPTTPFIVTTQLAQAHAILQLMDFADVRPAVDMLHAFILHTLSFATTVEDVCKMWLGPVTYASLDPDEQNQVYETCLANFQFKS